MIALYRSDYNSSSQSYSPTLVATYSYDPWGTPTGIYDANGNAISQTAYNVAAYNPFRYRGYRYDGDTRLYYLQSRYYDPAIGRFINADGPNFALANPYSDGITDKNYFAYCDNDPVNKSDNGGEFWTIVVGAVAGGLINGISTLIECQKSGESLKSSLIQTAISATSGAISGAVAGTGLGVVGQSVVGGILGAGESFARQMVKTKSVKKVDVGAVIGAGLSGVAGALVGGDGSLKGLKHAKTQRDIAINTIKKGGSIGKAAKNYASQTWRWAKNRHLGWNTFKGIVQGTISSKLSGQVFR